MQPKQIPQKEPEVSFVCCMTKHEMIKGAGAAYLNFSSMVLAPVQATAGEPSIQSMLAKLETKLQTPKSPRTT